MFTVVNHSMVKLIILGLFTYTINAEVHFRLVMRSERPLFFPDVSVCYCDGCMLVERVGIKLATPIPSHSEINPSSLFL